MEIKRLNEGSETWNANTGACTSAEIPFYIMQPGSKADAIQALLEAAPGTYSGLPLKEIRFEGYDAGGNMDLTAVYSERESSGGDDDEDEEATVSFDCGGGSQTIKTAYSQKRIIGTVSPGLSVGWNGKTGDDSEVAGVDVPTAQLRESYTKVMRLSRLTTKYKRKVAELVGCVNSKEFKGWDPGEVMFLGMSYSAPDKSSSRVTVTFNFMIQMNENMTLTGSVNGETQTIKYFKKGHQYIWSVTEERAEGTPVRPHVTLKGLFLADVCKYKDFGELGL